MKRAKSTELFSIGEIAWSEASERGENLVEWSIPSHFLVVNSLIYRSPKFDAFGSFWILRTSVTSSGVCLFYLRRTSWGSSMTIEQLWTIKKVDGTLGKFSCGVDRIDGDEVSSFDYLIKLEELKRERNKDTPLEIVTITCRMRLVENAWNLPPTGIYASSDNYMRLILSGEAWDFNIIVKQHSFPVHRALLQDYSPIFDALFREKNGNEAGAICVDDCEPEVFDQLLLFVYSGKVDDQSSRDLLHLYCAADKYGLSGLKEACVDAMKSSLDYDCICDVIHMAKAHGETVLLEMATDFFVRNLENILLTSEWLNYFKDNPTEANDLLIESLKSRPFRRRIVASEFTESIYRNLVELTCHPNNH